MHWNVERIGNMLPGFGVMVPDNINFSSFKFVIVALSFLQRDRIINTILQVYLMQNYYDVVRIF